MLRVIVSVCALALLLAVGCTAAHDATPPLMSETPAFDSAVWKATGDQGRPAEMALDIQKRNLVSSKSKQQVQELLGKPDSSTKDGGRTWVYRLDDGSWLRIRFSDGLVATDCEVAQDPLN